MLPPVSKHRRALNKDFLFTGDANRTLRVMLSACDWHESPFFIKTGPSQTNQDEHEVFS
jgi:hypothetical protein